MLKLSNDRKVSPRSRYERAAKRWAPIVPNAFGLPARRSCVGTTPFCDGCYAENIERAFPSVGRLLQGNLEALQACGSNVGAMAALLSDAMDLFEAACVKAERRTGEPIPRVFRIHWDGDFYSAQYAAAWAQVIRSRPSVSFWAYTRSFDYVGQLSGLDNLTLYLSVDEWNAAAARGVAAEHPWVRFALCGATWDDTEVLAQKVTGRNAPRCPELTGRTPLVSDGGVGACVTCGLCIRGTNNVRFAAKH